MCRGSEASRPVRACVGFCVCLGPAVESGVRVQARLGLLPRACLTSSQQGYLFWSGTDAAFDEDTRTWPAA